MNIEEAALLSLIKKSQFGVEDTINWTEVDMNALYNEAFDQSVLGIIASEIPDEYVTQKFVDAKHRQKASYILYCHSQDELKKILDDACIPFIILKGNASAISYADPTCRMMGDIDILVPQDLYDKTKDILSSAGYEKGYDNGRHCGFKKEKTSIEVHHHFSHFEEYDFESYIIDGLNLRELVLVDGHEFPMLPKLANGIVLLDHFRRHLQSSVGLRQTVDWMMYVYRNLDDDYWNSEFKAILEEKGLVKFVVTLTRMCQIYMGLPDTITWCAEADADLAKRLMENIFISGNFGKKNKAGYKVERVKVGFKHEGMFHALQRVGENTWDAYQKHHWLKPFCWIYQSFRFAKKFIKAGRTPSEFKDDMYRCDERYELLKELNIF